MAATVQNGFESSDPNAVPRNGQYVPVSGFTSNENTGVGVLLVPCEQCGAAVEDGAGLAKHESWHAAQAGAQPKNR